MQDTEKGAVDAILDKGIEISIPKRSVLKYFTKAKDRKFTIRQPYLGTLHSIARVSLEIEFSEDLIRGNAIAQSHEHARKDVKKLAKVIAIAICNSRWRIRLFSGILADYLVWRLTPERLLQLSVTVFTLSNTADFINSIRLISGARISQPKNLSPEERGG